MAAASPVHPLSGKQKLYLRGLAHALKPVVQVGRAGLSQEVIDQIDGALETHELAKVKAGSGCPSAPSELRAGIERGTGSTVVQIVGRILVVYRARRKAPRIILPSRLVLESKGGD